MSTAQVIIVSDQKECASLFTKRVQYLSYHNNTDWDQDYYIAMKAFEMTSVDSTVIICKDTAVSATPTDIILSIVDAALTEDESIDVLYLSKWMDRCDLYSEKREFGAVKIVKTFSPNGFHCLLFTPSGRKKLLNMHNPKDNALIDKPLSLVLNSYIGSGLLNAATTYPSLVQFDISKRKNDDELLKTTECRQPPVIRDYKHEKSEGGSAYLWFIIVAVIIVILITLMIKYGIFM